MKLVIDGICVTPQPDESLLDLVRRIGLDDPLLSNTQRAKYRRGEKCPVIY